MSVKNKKITVNSPATIANLGPGFDSIGASVDIWNNFEFIFDTDTTSIQIEGEGKSVLPNNNTNAAANINPHNCFVLAIENTFLISLILLFDK